MKRKADGVWRLASCRGDSEDWREDERRREVKGTERRGDTKSLREAKKDEERKRAEKRRRWRGEKRRRKAIGVT